MRADERAEGAGDVSGKADKDGVEACRQHLAGDGQAADLAAGEHVSEAASQQAGQAAGQDASGSSGDVDVEWARTTSVVKLPNFLSNDEIDELHRVAAELQCDEASEYRGGRDAGTAWRVLYLQAGNGFERLLPQLHAKVRAAAADADAAGGWGLLSPLDPDDWSLRCAEYHSMRRSGGLPDPGHYDNGSLVTVDIMLSRPGIDHVGGAFTTREPDGSERALYLDFAQGDALAFVSHKPHFVSPLSDGVRRVLVVEFWRGEARTCPHRCTLPRPGACVLTIESARAQSDAEFEDAFFASMDMPLLEAAMAAL